jgi:hypothetical protein
MWSCADLGALTDTLLDLLQRESSCAHLAPLRDRAALANRHRNRLRHSLVRVRCAEPLVADRRCRCPMHRQDCCTGALDWGKCCTAVCACSLLFVAHVLGTGDGFSVRACVPACPRQEVTRAALRELQRHALHGRRELRRGLEVEIDLW